MPCRGGARFRWSGCGNLERTALYFPTRVEQSRCKGRTYTAVSSSSRVMQRGEDIRDRNDNRDNAATQPARKNALHYPLLPRKPQTLARCIRNPRALLPSPHAPPECQQHQSRPIPQTPKQIHLPHRPRCPSGADVLHAVMPTVTVDDRYELLSRKAGKVRERGKRSEQRNQNFLPLILYSTSKWDSATTHGMTSIVL